MSAGLRRAVKVPDSDFCKWQKKKKYVMFYNQVCMSSWRLQFSTTSMSATESLGCWVALQGWALSVFSPGTSTLSTLSSVLPRVLVHP